jgi:ATP-dependent Clp protease ATP-binding subunit ClpB
MMNYTTFYFIIRIIIANNIYMSQNQQNTQSPNPNLDKYARNLIRMAKNGKLDPIIGRDDEIRRILQILSRRTKNNPIIVGESGVGKTAIIEGIAHRIVRGDIPENLKEVIIYELDLGAVMAGAMHKGEFEQRLKGVITEVTNSNGKFVLFIDEIHTMVSAGAGGGAVGAADLVKPALARGEMRTIGATTLNEYQKYIENDKALERRFQRVFVDEPEIEETIAILRGIKEKYEMHHKVVIKDDALIAAAELSNRYITDRHLPDKAIDLMDEACAKLRMELNSVPEEVDDMNREILKLEIEREAMKREKNKSKLKEVEGKIAKLKAVADKINATWNGEKKIIEDANKAKKKVEKLKLKFDEVTRKEIKGDSDFKKLYELQHKELPEAEKAVADAFAKLKELENSGSRMMREEVHANDIAEVVAKMTGIPVSRMTQGERDKLLVLEDELHKRIIGQNNAVVAVSDAIRINRSGLGNEKKPIGSFLFLGTTGVGKTELGKALAEYLFNDETMLTRIDMSEYQEKHSASRMVGAPPGYVGYEEGGQLTEAARRKPYSVILLDEIEKAHPDVLNVLLQVLDDGRLTDNKGRVASFKNTIIIMTSNMGSDAIIAGINNVEKLKASGKESGEFGTEAEIMEKSGAIAMAMLKAQLRPEFLNRIDKTIIFDYLNRENIRDIVELQFKSLQKKLNKNGIKLTANEDAFAKMTEMSYEPQFGARPVKRMIHEELLNRLSKELLASNISQDSEVEINVKDNQFTFKTLKKVPKKKETA